MVHRFYTTADTARMLTRLKNEHGFYFRTLTKTDIGLMVKCEVTEPGYEFIKTNLIKINE